MINLNFLANDYLSASQENLAAARVLYENKGEYIYRFNNVIMTLLGHSLELLLKAIAAHSGRNVRDPKEFKNVEHDLLFWLGLAEQSGVKFNSNLKSFITSINDNFKNHDYRYPRALSGFPEEDEERLNDILLTGKHISDRGSARILRNHGLVVTSGYVHINIINDLAEKIEEVGQFFDREKTNAPN